MLLTVTALPPIPDTAAPKGDGAAGADAFAPLIAALTVAPSAGKVLPPPGQPAPGAATGAPASGDPAPPGPALIGGPALDSPGAAGQPGAPSAAATPDRLRALAPVAEPLPPGALAAPCQAAAAPAGGASPPWSARLAVTPPASAGRARGTAKSSEQAHADGAAADDAGAAGCTAPPATAFVVAAFVAAAPVPPGFACSIATTAPAAPADRRAAATMPGAATLAAIGPATIGTQDAPPVVVADGDAGARSGPSPEPQSHLMATDSASAPSTRSPARPAGAPTLPANPVAAAGSGPIALAAARTDRAGPASPTVDAVPAQPGPSRQPTAPAIVPALQAFGAAMRQALADERRPARRGAEPIGIALTSAPTATAGSAAATAAPLDTVDARWPQAMVEHIERLRDAADAASTRIRLLPDALGPIDVTVRRDGDAVHVHLAAPSAETRQLLQDAQPRLAEAAEQRGVKLARAEVSAGFSDAGGGGDRQPPRTPAPFIRAPRPAPAQAAAADADGARIA